MHSAELETLDQMLGGDLRLEAISKLFPSSGAFEQGVLGLLSCGDVVLLTVATETKCHSGVGESYSPPIFTNEKT